MNASDGEIVHAVEGEQVRLVEIGEGTIEAVIALIDGIEGGFRCVVAGAGECVRRAKANAVAENGAERELRAVVGGGTGAGAGDVRFGVIA